MTHYNTVEVDGLRIFYRTAGSMGQPVILLLHGFPASSFMFRELMEKLADRFYLVAPDYPGFGYSDAPAPKDYPYTFDNLADVIQKFTEKLNLAKFSLYMQDFGGPVGFRLASNNPEKINSLIVQNANAYEEGLPDEFWAPVRTLWSHPTKENYNKIREAAMSKEALEWNYTHGVTDPRKISPDSWVLQSALLDGPERKEIMLALLYDYRTNLALYPSWQDYFRKRQPPTLIVWGRNDVIFPASGAYPYQRDLKNLAFNLLDTGHFALEEEGDQIAEHIRQFLARAFPE